MAFKRTPRSTTPERTTRAACFCCYGQGVRLAESLGAAFTSGPTAEAKRWLGASHYSVQRRSTTYCGTSFVLLKRTPRFASQEGAICPDLGSSKKKLRWTMHALSRLKVLK